MPAPVKHHKQDGAPEPDKFLLERSV